MLKVKELT